MLAAVETAAVAQQSPDEDEPALLQADQVTYNQKTKIVTAEGNVEVAQGERILLTDKVTYDLDDDVISATGNVTLLEPSGEVMFAESVELTGDLREGAVRSFRMLLTDRSRLAAANAVRVEGNVTEMRKVVFSPCRPCEEDPDAPPLWQIKAQKVVHDQEAKVLVYRNARLEMFGVPVLYTPYFEHPDPTVDRKSGFLTPSFGVSEELGAEVQVPYYYAISPQRDFTFEPIITSKQGPVLSGEYRARTSGGRYSIEGSATIADREDSGGFDNDVFRGHIDATGQFNLDKYWRWGFDAQRTTDDTYLRIYDFGDDRFLTSEAYVEGLAGNNYLSARTFAFQGQRTRDDTDKLPIVLPEVRFDGLTDPEHLGGRLFAEGGLLGITRPEGRDSRRASATLGWTRPYHDNVGGVIDITTALHSDLYSTNGVDPNSDLADPPAADALGSDVTGRVFPQVALGYRYPVTRDSFIGREVLEPRVQLVAGPNGGNPDEIPNEDSRDFEFDDSNLFDLNRFPGRDRISSGQRVDYGLAYAIYGTGFSSLSTFVGQSYRINTDDAVPDSAGEDGDFSDIVGRVEISPLSQIDAVYRFRLDDDSLEPRRSELDLGLGPPKLRLDLNYTFLDSEGAESTFDEDREELFARVRTRFAEHWTAFGSHRRDLESGDALSTALGLRYHDECYLLDVRAQRTFFDDREIDPDTSIMFQVAFKHLGMFASQ